MGGEAPRGPAAPVLTGALLCLPLLLPAPTPSLWSHGRGQAEGPVGSGGRKGSALSFPTMSHRLEPGRG